MPGVRRRLSLQHGARHGGHLCLRRRRQILPDDVPAILEGRNRTAAGPTVPAGGLYMTKLWYQEDVL